MKSKKGGFYMSKMKRKNQSFFDLEKELQFLNEKLKEGYLLKDVTIKQYEFEETAIKGQYYIAYITSDEQKQELNEMADEVTQIANEDFHSVQRLLKRTNNSLYRTDKLKGTWVYYFSPTSFDYCLTDDMKRRREVYSQFLKWKMLDTMIGVIFVICIPMMMLYKTQMSFADLYMPWKMIDMFLLRGDWSFIIAWIMISALIYEYIFPFIFAYWLYQIIRLYKNWRSCI